MSERYLGKTFDIHGGGLDLIFPHHENEIAQSRCAHGTDVMARYWMHNGFLQVEGRKMSKSEGNFVTIHDLLATETFGGRKWPGGVLRLAMLMTHYREPIDFSVRRLEEAENVLKALSERAEGSFGYAIMPPVVLSCLYDDLNTPAAINWLMVESGNGRIGPDSLRLGLDILGVTPIERRDLNSDEVASVAKWIDRRLAFIRDKNWPEADRIRDELLAQGIQLKDGKDPATGERITTWEVKR
jgi:cysteinyl-tRNA synthetase